MGDSTDKTPSIEDFPWAGLPAELGGWIAPELPALADEVIRAVGRDVAEYRRPLDGRFGTNVRLGVQVALGRFLQLPGTSQPALVRDREVYVALGRGELRDGRTLEALLGAYRAGARVAFRRFAEIARAHGMSADHVIPLAESMFAYIDELSAASVEGYAAEQAERAGERDRRRRELAQLVLSGTGDVTAVAALAQRVGWALPREIAVVVVPAERGDGLATRLGAAALVGEYAEAAVAVVPAPSRRTARTRLAGQLAGREAAVGPAVAWRDAPVSLRMARLAGRLRSAGVAELGASDPVWADEHLVTLLLRRDDTLRELLVGRWLAPLDGARPATRERLAETLLAWLAYRGERQRVADALHVHPQTIGYRLTQLRELFGEQIDDPDARFAIELALRARGTGFGVPASADSGDAEAE